MRSNTRPPRARSSAQWMISRAAIRPPCTATCARTTRSSAFLAPLSSPRSRQARARGTPPRSQAQQQQAGQMATEAEKKQLILDSIRGIPDFPKPGILFWDVTTIMLNPTAFQAVIDLFVERYRGQKVDVVAGFEARGLIFGAPLALALGAAFVPLRKPGKLPGAKISESYVTEYSTDTIEMHEGHVKPGQRVVLVDDLIATGGTLNAGINLIKKAGGEVVETAVVIELPDLHGRSKIQGTPLFVLVEKHGL